MDFLGLGLGLEVKSERCRVPSPDDDGGRWTGVARTVRPGAGPGLN